MGHAGDTTIAKKRSEFPRHRFGSNLSRVEVAPYYIVWLADELIAAGYPGTATALLHADAHAMQSIALTAHDREALLQVLEDPPEELGELRDALLDQDLWRHLV